MRYTERRFRRCPKFSEATCSGKFRRGVEKMCRFFLYGALKKKNAIIHVTDYPSKKPTKAPPAPKEPPPLPLITSFVDAPQPTQVVNSITHHSITIWHTFWHCQNKKFRISPNGVIQLESNGSKMSPFFPPLGFKAGTCELARQS